jgi:hypothetical protein
MILLNRILAGHALTDLVLDCGVYIILSPSHLVVPLMFARGRNQSPYRLIPYRALQAQDLSRRKQPYVPFGPLKNSGQLLSNGKHKRLCDSLNAMRRG